jgi:hypothetical protein
MQLVSFSLLAVAGWCARWFNPLYELYLKIQLHRRTVSMIGFRLVIGWTWEVFITAVVNVIADAHTLELHQLVGVDFAIFVICLVIGLVLHYFLKDLQVEYPSEAIMATAVQDTENPLQVAIDHY